MAETPELRSPRFCHGTKAELEPRAAMTWPSSDIDHTSLRCPT